MTHVRTLDPRLGLNTWSGAVPRAGPAGRGNRDSVTKMKAPHGLSHISSDLQVSPWRSSLGLLNRLPSFPIFGSIQLTLRLLAKPFCPRCVPIA